MKTETMTAEKVRDITSGLNSLLASQQVYYQNLRGFHWNVKGPRFFELHVKFEEMYNAANNQIDEVAERAKTLGSTPIHTFEDYVKHSQIEAEKDVFDTGKMVAAVAGNLKVLLEISRSVLNKAAEAGDEATVAQMGDYIREYEKELWMFNSFAS